MQYLQAGAVLFTLTTGKTSSLPKDPVCDKTQRFVLKFLRQLSTVGPLNLGSAEVVFYEGVGPLQREKVHVLHKSDYQVLRRKVTDSKKLQDANIMRGVSGKMLVELKDGWLLGNGLAFNATHKFYMGFLNERDCIENPNLKKHGRDHCAKEDWVMKSLLQIIDAESTFTCERVSSAIAMVYSSFNDFGQFQESVLPMLLWPVVQKLRDSIVLWQFGNQAFIMPWMELLGLKWRVFDGPIMSMQKHNRVITKFDTLYLPLWLGSNDDLSYSHKLAYAPASDLQQVRQTALRATELVQPRKILSYLPSSKRYALLVERIHLEKSRRFSEDDAAGLRRLMAANFGSLHGMSVLSFSQSGGNEFRVELLDAGKGFSGQLKGLTLAEALQVWASADVIVGAHGGLLHHLIVVPKGAHVVEFQNRDDVPLTFYHTCSVFGFHYYFHPVEGSHTAGRFLELDIEAAGKLLAMVSKKLSSARTGDTHAEQKESEL